MHPFIRIAKSYHQIFDSNQPRKEMSEIKTKLEKFINIQGDKVNFEVSQKPMFQLVDMPKHVIRIYLYNDFMTKPCLSDIVT